MALLQMLVDDIGDVTTTNDGATILKLLEVEHPAAKVDHHSAAGPVHAAMMRSHTHAYRGEPSSRSS